MSKFWEVMAIARSPEYYEQLWMDFNGIFFMQIYIYVAKE